MTCRCALIHSDPFQDERLRVANLPVEPQRVTVRHPVSDAEKHADIALFRKPGEVAGTRRAISEILKWMNYGPTTGLSPWPRISPSPLTWNTATSGVTTIQRPIRSAPGSKPLEEGNASSAIGLVGQSAALDPQQFAGVVGLERYLWCLYPLMYLPARVWSQQNQDSRFRMGVLHILAGHSGPETAADARTHFGIFAPQVWKLFPRGQAIHLSFWDYNDVASMAILRRRRSRQRGQGGRYYPGSGPA